jgi:quercetin dioxygenase-like cupin family protein
VRTELAKGTTDAPISIVSTGGLTTLYVQSLTLKPAASSGWHTHPGPEYSVITDGAVFVQTADDCAGHDAVDGQAVFIPGGLPHRVVNHGPHDASVVVTYTLPADLPVRGDAADSCT